MTAVLDEFTLIRRHFAGLTPATPAVRLGIGDDAALLQVRAGCELAITSDTLIAGRHFPHETLPADIGWKSLAVNLSDLAAMGAAPLAFTLALSLPQADDNWLRGFAQGLGDLARMAGVPLVGGDTTRGALSITITALGEVPAGTALRRDGARVGDLVCVTGTLGDAAAALRQWQAGSAGVAALRARLDRPTPRLAAGRALRGLAHAAIDLSDGLAGDLGHILAASGVGARLDPSALPCSEDLREVISDVASRVALQLNGGDDYELCCCLPPERFAAAQAALAPLPLTVIGEIEAEPGLRLLAADGSIQEHPPQAYRHF